MSTVSRLPDQEQLDRELRRLFGPQARSEGPLAASGAGRRFHKGQRVYVVTSGYLKKAHRTSRSEIDRAMRLKRQYEEASEQ